MNSKLQIVLAAVVGAALGAAGSIQGLHAQAKPKAYQITERSTSAGSILI